MGDRRARPARLLVSYLGGVLTVFIPGCPCCGVGCPRPCQNITTVACRFHIPAGSGDPFANLPLRRYSGNRNPDGSLIYDTDWFPGHPYSSPVSWPEIDETLVIDITKPPPSTITGNYGSLSLTSTLDSTGAITDCRLNVSFSYSVMICRWPYWRYSSSLGWVYAGERDVKERVGVSHASAPAERSIPYVLSAASLGASNFSVTTSAQWIGVNGSGGSWTRIIQRAPAVFRDCDSQPASWPVTEDTSVGLAVGGEYTIQDYTNPGGYPLNPGFTILIPYMIGSVDGADYTLDNPNFIAVEEPLRWRRVLPEPTLTITVT